MQIEITENGEYYAGCMFTWNRRNDAAALPLADIPYDEV